MTHVICTCGENRGICIDCDGEEIDRLRAENANLRHANRGRTFYHSDPAVMEELGRLRVENEELRSRTEIARRKEEV